MKNAIINEQLSLKKIVTSDDSAIKVGSGLVDVFATPSLIALCEKTSSDLLAKFLDAGEVSVGININIDHIAATKIGSEVKAIASISDVNGRKITFNLLVYEQDKLIAKGSHIRCVVNKEKFLSKLN